MLIVIYNPQKAASIVQLHDPLYKVESKLYVSNIMFSAFISVKAERKQTLR